MIELFYAPTPNGKKISIMLEEIKFDYKITKIDLSKGDQFSSDFRKISPFSKMPAIIDHKNKVNLSQSGAILIYLAELSGKFYDENNRLLINQWLMTQMGDIGPMLGQHHQFHHYNPGKSKFGEERYFNIAKRIYKDLDERLSASDFLAGDKLAPQTKSCSNIPAPPPPATTTTTSTTKNTDFDSEITEIAAENAIRAGKKRKYHEI